MSGHAGGQSALERASSLRQSERSSRARRRDLAALTTYVALSVFVAAMVVAIASYPGGSWTAPQASGFSLARNFWCDLMRSQAINGVDNSAAKAWASVSFAALGVALWPFWWVAGSLASGRRRWLVTGLGTASAACLAAMTVLPSDHFRLAHGIVALSGGALGMGASVLNIAARSPRERFGLRQITGALALLLAACNAALYVYVAYLTGPETVAQPIVQKLATSMLLAWMFITVQHARTHGRG